MIGDVNETDDFEKHMAVVDNFKKCAAFNTMYPKFVKPPIKIARSSTTEAK